MGWSSESTVYKNKIKARRILYLDGWLRGEAFEEQFLTLSQIFRLGCFSPTIRPYHGLYVCIADNLTTLIPPDAGAAG
ncbi:hypothetical protein [Funiculus sociatus]|uniref:hypothetical protein n=1 Tax=Funiculus sociatus TaxID=450527 RepID=UPI0019A46F88|nr:hypothetical protein [Trichocoleus sp. FACHB-69]